MESKQENSDQQDNSVVPAPTVSLGKMLREARERLGFSVADVAAQIKFAPRQIEDLEADNFADLPEAAFLRGFVRSYAKILHLDTEVLLKAIPQPKVAVPDQVTAPVKVKFPGAPTTHRQNMIVLAAALLIAIIAIGFAMWHFSSPLKQTEVAQTESAVSLPDESQALSDGRALKEEVTEPSRSADTKSQSLKETEKTSPGSTKSAPAQEVSKSRSTDSEIRDDGTRKIDKVVTAPVKKEIQASSAVRQSDSTKHTAKVRLVFDEESWTEITGGDGKLLSSQIYSRGSELNMEAPLPLSLVIGHAATTHLYLDGEPIDLTPFINSSSEVARLTLE